MALPASYLPTVEWKTTVKSVVMVDPLTYNVTIEGDNPNDTGFEQKEAGFYLTDYVGHIYPISVLNIDGNPNRVQVTDLMSTGKSPQSGRTAIVSKSVGEGNAFVISPVSYNKLDKSAFDYRHSIDLDILYKGKGDNGRIENLSSRTQSVVFKNYYTEAPVGRNSVFVYRPTEEEPYWENVVIKSLVIDKDRFVLIIDDSEPLEGIIIEYNFNSRT
jgi:hypothetical protein